MVEASSVPLAFDLLLEEIEVEVGEVSEAGSRAFDARDHDAARRALEEAEWLSAFRSRVAELRAAWAAHRPEPPVDADGVAVASRRNLGRAPRGLRTPDDAYFRHILRALVELGGSARVGEVLSRVEPAMAGVLRPVDREPLPSDPQTPRWRNAAQWARYEMVKQGLLKDDSPHGVWAISETGRRWLAVREQAGSR